MADPDWKELLQKAAKANEFDVEGVGAQLSGHLEAEIADGFGERSDGEDRFDAVVGLLAMLHVIQSRIPEGIPREDSSVASVEGWILGRPSDHFAEQE